MHHLLSERSIADLARLYDRDITVYLDQDGPWPISVALVRSKA